MQTLVFAKMDWNTVQAFLKESVYTVKKNIFLLTVHMTQLFLHNFHQIYGYKLFFVVVASNSLQPALLVNLSQENFVNFECVSLATFMYKDSFTVY